MKKSIAIIAAALILCFSGILAHCMIAAAQQNREYEKYSTDLGKCTITGEKVNYDFFLRFYDELKAIQLPSEEEIRGNNIDELYDSCMKVKEEAFDATCEFARIQDMYCGFDGMREVDEALYGMEYRFLEEPEKSAQGIERFREDLRSYLRDADKVLKAADKKYEEFES